MGAEIIEQLTDLITNPIFLSSFFGWFVAQMIKGLIDVIRSRTGGTKNLLQTLFWTTGGMPSSHSSVVVALATSIGFAVESPTDPVFILSVVYAFLTIRDALGVRRSAGRNAQLLNKMSKDLKEKLDLEYERVREVNGHKASEVLVGILLGFFLGVAFSVLA
jgi:acid phosphatase family membrane protein YuiD